MTCTSNQFCTHEAIKEERLEDKHDQINALNDDNWKTPFYWLGTSFVRMLISSAKLTFSLPFWLVSHLDPHPNPMNPLKINDRFLAGYFTQ